MNVFLRRWLAAAVITASVAVVGGLLREDAVAASVKPPTVGENAMDFTLQTVDGEKVQLSSLVKKGPDSHCSFCGAFRAINVLCVMPRSDNSLPVPETPGGGRNCRVGLSGPGRRAEAGARE